MCNGEREDNSRLSASEFLITVMGVQMIHPDITFTFFTYYKFPMDFYWNLGFNAVSVLDYSLLADRQ